jgi:hypothetical protein
MFYTAFFPEQGLFPLASATLTKDKLKQIIRHTFLNIHPTNILTKPLDLNTLTLLQF